MSEESGGVIVDLIIGVAVFLILTSISYSVFLKYLDSPVSQEQNDLERLKDDFNLLTDRFDFIEVPLFGVDYEVWFFSPGSNLKDCGSFACFCSVKGEKITGCERIKKISDNCDGKNFCSSKRLSKFVVGSGKRFSLKVCSKDYEVFIGGDCVES